MAKTPISLLLLKRLTLTSQNPKPPPLSLFLYFKPYSTTTTTNPSTEPPKPNSLSARMSFVFDQIDAIERERAQKHQTLQKIRAWRQSKDTPQQQEQTPETISTQNPEISGNQNPEMIKSQNEELESGFGGNGDLKESNLVSLKKNKKEVEVVHPWPEWIELMQRLVQQNYFDHRRKVEDKMVESLGLDVGGVGNDDGDDDDGVGIDFNDYKTVQTACLNFGKDRFDIFRFVDFMFLV